MKKYLFVFTNFLVLVFSFSSHAFYSVMESGEMVPESGFRAVAYPQLNLTGDYAGLNMIAGLDAGISEETSVRAILGTGSVDFIFGGSMKWIPFPDIDNQPAIGGTVGLTYGTKDNESILAFRVAPLASKTLDVVFGTITPIVALPLGITFYDGHTQFPVNLTAGAEAKITNWDGVRLLAELAFNLNDSFSYFSAGASYDFK